MDNPAYASLSTAQALHAFLSRCMRCNTCVVTGTNVHVRFPIEGAECVMRGNHEVQELTALPDLDPLFLI